MEELEKYKYVICILCILCILKIEILQKTWTKRGQNLFCHQKCSFMTEDFR